MTSSLWPIAHRAPNACRAASTKSALFCCGCSRMAPGITSVTDIPHFGSLPHTVRAQLRDFRDRRPSSPIRRRGRHGGIPSLPEAALDGAVGEHRAHRDEVTHQRLQVGPGLLGLARDGPRRPWRVPGAACNLAIIVHRSGDNARSQVCAGMRGSGLSGSGARRCSALPCHPACPCT
jgi:hypothetical protein